MKRARVGDAVFVKGTRTVRHVIRLMSDVPGGVVLDKPVDGFRLWNVDALRSARPGRNPRKKNPRV